MELSAKKSPGSYQHWLLASTGKPSFKRLLVCGGYVCLPSYPLDASPRAPSGHQGGEVMGKPTYWELLKHPNWQRKRTFDASIKEPE